MDNTNAVETADSNPGEPRQSNEITVTVTLSRTFVDNALKSSDDVELAAILRNALRQATH